MEKDIEFVKEITSKEKDFSQWYVDVVRKTELADYTTIKGCMVIRPYGYGLWENMQAGLDRRIKETGHKNAYFPLFIPESLLKKEAEHVEGFAPEVAWVTEGGSQKLEERLAIRPTSEAIICSLYSKWVRSWRDLPILINQWVNIVRWEKVTRLFLRTTEFLWQEGHTAHKNEQEAEEETLKILNQVYRDYIENDLAIPVIVGRKTEKEKFAGALHTYTLEALMTDGKVLQAGTSHNLGQNFAKAFNIKYLDEDQQEKYVWQTSWGTTTRLIGALVMVHGDDRGLNLPPKVAPVQVIIIPIMFDKTKKEVRNKAEDIITILKKDFRVEIDSRDEYTPGWKFNEWEMKGVPLRLEIGPKDLAKSQVMMVRRDTGEKMAVKEEKLVETVEKLLNNIQENLFNKAKSFLQKNIREVSDYNKFKEIMEKKRGLIKTYWCGNKDCEDKIKEETKASIRCIPFEQEEASGKCICCGKESSTVVYFARAY
ncbi:MAG: proline--tRNA ligase [Candidatus Infernicultor aquiphilus]|uniref:Proline--tRNA ligase n=1 Tax=Candidatus Infernicultor aquiphilus TaxID=1805029 RepID=A0A1J5GHL9_9BACT|nr:proline--tRNA ligase [bacterium]OIP72293.1 MAG: proline--tRNA ligase [Candidatus Atribacteria bacterium CG2_30_33_13]PIU25831.1 MAG: proline--tRNA ligase [Candidatus Atribacteria bacterium CG08_land_8_20_14_0_20_33_29]PIW12161.1 MAG: proline--tRNA ligase [Candidatus Atribacteria bacterium CG17_big_fil_post_rev_8_21_14_2_50_34_11]PIX34647.1 MAG: proline--tRNA ligase [Candidatus Atribacteria bacterium CG_4_8_14_3_um_filter_34_18]PIY32873.1 MAG: proline--tRNA ligase [Candidatus Atribacteria ba